VARNIPIYLKEWIRGTWRDPYQHFQQRRNRKCPCCGHIGKFVSAKLRGPREFRCPNCASRPRDRQIALILKEYVVSFDHKRILHIAPEWPLFRTLRSSADYVGGDIIKRRNANAIVDVTDIHFDDKWFDILICNHVLEHVPEDNRAMRECYRILKKGGIAIFSVPIDLKRHETWEPPADMPEDEVERVCGWDHVRLYGLDFSRKLEDVGFSVRPIIYDGDVREVHGLLEEPIYLAMK